MLGEAVFEPGRMLFTRTFAVAATGALVLSACGSADRRFEPPAYAGAGGQPPRAVDALAGRGGMATSPPIDVPPPACGNGVVDTGEECDGSAMCTSECLLVECGNDRVEEGEECDPPIAGSCGSNCRLLTCGNEQLDEGEECDPPGGRCNARCLELECGNARLDEGEECDPPAAGQCSADCALVACGNERLDEGEGCDPPVPGQCDEQCRPIGCGNSRVDAGEECDPPVAGRCDGKCQTIACGNSRVDTGEECDPPAAGKCDGQCRNIACGNSRVDTGEQCEPPGMGKCNALCRTIACGDGRLDPGELCERSSPNDATCSASCTPVGGGKTILFGFDSNIDPWRLYMTSPTRLANDTVVAYNSQNGDATPGCLRVQAPFDMSNQKVEFQATFSTPLDLRGRTLHARVRLASGISDDAVNPAGIKFFVKAGANYDYASGDWTLLTGSSWAEVTFVGDAPILVPGTFTAVDVRQIGFELRVFTETQRPTTGVIYVDSIWY